ncbi:phytoene desaturase [Treponema sp. OMZ 787]|uniref:phytoene desaturase family protein n=1 Tax=Treponema sp. OMZ 787 TaxID=2563669 RepID=UPI0020A52D4F|nr:phytoene desaturase family protein [Treponema sp. OMZ 787]UTC61749.1 phytoene desaturase [Treponema sp. OMZ 787]
MNKKVLVVGAGIAGLSAAIRLKHAGYEVEIFEQGAMPGGKMHRIEADGHSFDVGPTLVMMPSVYREIFELAGKNADDYIPMTKLDPMYEVYFKDKDKSKDYRHYVLNSDLVDLMKITEKKGPDNARGFLSYISEIYKRYQIALDHFITRPFRKWSDIYNPFMLLQALKLKTFDSADKMMASFMPDSDLHRMLSFQTLYIGVSPKKGPSLYNIIPMIELLYGVWFIKGGMHTMASQMARLFEELGGKINYNSKVDKILTEGKTVKGLLVGGEKIEAPYVVCNADFPYAMTNLIDDGRVRGKYSPEKINKMDYSCSCLVFYWGVDGTYPELPAHAFVVSEDLDDNLKSIFDGRRIKDPSVYLHIPSNVDPSMAPEGKSSFYLLIPVSEVVTSQYEWNEETVDYYRQKAIDSLSKLPGLENLKNSIAVEKVFTPKDFEKNFSAYRGATFGLQPTLTQSNHLRPQAKAKNCEGLYFCGSSTHPGAGVPIVMQSGKICAEELRRDNPEDNFSDK